MTLSLYLHDAYLKEAQAIILDVAKDEKRWLIILDQTIFYPMGGGQPTDQGIISTDTWKGKVTQALLKDDKIVHYVESDQPPPVGTLVKMDLNWDRRYLNMRLHSAGHVVDFAMFQLGYTPKLLMPLKGDHGKKAVICYQGTLDKDIREELEAKANDLIAQDQIFSFRLVKLEELERESIYLQPGLPKNKPLRLLTLSNVGSVADGGTQVNKTSEVGKISILPIETKDGMTYIHYRLA